MPSTVLLAPHHDDETLFAAFLAIQYEADLVVCTRGEVQGERGLPITHTDRASETDEAWSILRPGADWVQWPFSDNPNRILVEGDDVDAAVAELAARYDTVLAPAVEKSGHSQHNAFGALALIHFGPARTVSYLTYTPAGRSTNGVRVVPEYHWIMRKLRALACYRTQIAEPSCRPHFLRGLDEYVAAP